jgi:hypothetical protein
MTTCKWFSSTCGVDLRPRMSVRGLFFTFELLLEGGKKNAEAAEDSQRKPSFRRFSAASAF